MTGEQIVRGWIETDYRCHTIPAGRVALERAIDAALARACAEEREACVQVADALRNGLAILRNLDAYQQHPDRGNPDAECACCMGELFDDQYRRIMESMASAIRAIGGQR